MRGLEPADEEHGEKEDADYEDHQEVVDGGRLHQLPVGRAGVLAKPQHHHQAEVGVAIGPRHQPLGEGLRDRHDQEHDEANDKASKDALRRRRSHQGEHAREHEADEYVDQLPVPEFDLVPKEDDPEYFVRVLLVPLGGVEMPPPGPQQGNTGQDPLDFHLLSQSVDVAHQLLHRALAWRRSPRPSPSYMPHLLLFGRGPIVVGENAQVSLRERLEASITVWLDESVQSGSGIDQVVVADLVEVPFGWAAPFFFVSRSFYLDFEGRVFSFEILLSAKFVPDPEQIILARVKKENDEGSQASRLQLFCTDSRYVEFVQHPNCQQWHPQWVQNEAQERENESCASWIMIGARSVEVKAQQWKVGVTLHALHRLHRHCGIDDEAKHHHRSHKLVHDGRRPGMGLPSQLPKRKYDDGW
mmetsp:Transcript_4246/g.10893  ORF Transcript_4246/g.10893 Transcript_4246/m.10893 type:complete len:414 (-) Transcript_4246:895-2136(-)